MRLLLDANLSPRHVAPVLRPWPLPEQPLDAADDRAELMVAERPDEDATGVFAPSLGPLAEDRREVAAVPGHEDALL